MLSESTELGLLRYAHNDVSKIYIWRFRAKTNSRGGAGGGALVLRQQNEVPQVTGPRAADL